VQELKEEVNDKQSVFRWVNVQLKAAFKSKKNSSKRDGDSDGMVGNPVPPDEAAATPANSQASIPSSLDTQPLIASSRITVTRERVPKHKASENPTPTSIDIFAKQPKKPRTNPTAKRAREESETESSELAIVAKLASVVPSAYGPTPVVAPTAVDEGAPTAVASPAVDEGDEVGSYESE